MSLETTINNDIKAAMIAKDKQKLEALRAIKAALLIIKTGKDSEITEELELKTIQKLVKQRKESAQMYKEQNRAELYDEEIFQAKIIEAYLPQQLSEQEIETIVKSIIEQLGEVSLKDIGKVMGIATKQLAGKADNSLVSKIVKQNLV